MARPRKTRRTKAALRDSNKRRSSTLFEEQSGLAPSPEPEDLPSIEDEGRDSGGGGGGDDEDGVGSDLPHSDVGPFGRVRKPRLAAADRAGRCRGFHIARIIPYSSKTGGDENPPYGPDDNDVDAEFQYRIGDFVLVLSPESTLRVTVRNYEGYETQLPRRMLQTLYRPWFLPAKIRLDDTGVPFPLKFVKDSKSIAEGDGTRFYKREAVMVMRESSGNKRFNEVVDFERKAGSVRKTSLRTLYDVPWGLRVDRDELAERWELMGAPKPRRSDRVLNADSESSEEEDSSGEEESYGGEDSSGSEGHDIDESSEDEEEDEEIEDNE